MCAWYFDAFQSDSDSDGRKESKLTSVLVARMYLALWFILPATCRVSPVLAISLPSLSKPGVTLQKPWPSLRMTASSSSKKMNLNQDCLNRFFFSVLISERVMFFLCPFLILWFYKKYQIFLYLCSLSPFFLLWNSLYNIGIHFKEFSHKIYWAWWALGSHLNMLCHFSTVTYLFRCVCSSMKLFFFVFF